MPLQSTYKTFKTVAKMKAAVGFVADELVYLSEAGREGLWYYDATDTTTAENTGIVIVTTTGSLRLKRRLEGDFVSKRWFSGSNIYFNDLADANATIPVASRYRGMLLYIMVSSVLTPYWYRDGTADINLVQLAQEVTLTNGPTTSDRTQNLISAPTPTTIQVKSIGLTGNGGIQIIRTSGATTEDFLIDISALVTTTTGTFSQRPVSPVNGQEFYQTDILEGQYRYDGANWTYVPDGTTVLFCKFFGSALPYNGNVTGTSSAHFQSIGRFFGWTLQTGTDTTGQAQLRTNTQMTLGGSTGKIIHYAKINIPTLSDGTNTFIVRMGRPSGTEGVGIWFRYTDAVNSGKFQCITHNGTTPTTTDSGITVVAGTDYELVTVYDQTGTDNVKFYINNVLVQTITTTLPATFGSTSYFGSVSIEKTAGGTSRTMDVIEAIIKRVF